MTRYYLGDYEEEVSSTGSIRKIYYLGDGAVYVSNNGKDSLLFTYKDHLGSLVALTDYNGSVMERYAYDPWGGRRSPTDWTQKDTRTSWRLNRGYTMHEHLDAFGIINMNGRVYDPLTAQFFSPDPYVQSLDNWLNYNRYSYCLNNPLIYTDPDGESFWIFPYISFDKGGISFGISVGIGFGPKFGISASVGYSTGDKSFTATAGASFGPANAYIGYNSNAGFITGAGIGFGSVYNGNFINVSSNIMNIGLNYSANGGLSGNYMGLSISQHGVSFNPSITAGVPISFYTDNYEGPAKAAYMKDSPFKNKKEMLDDLKAKGFTPGKHKINKYIYEEWDGKSKILGQTRAVLVGNKLTYLSITMWPHETIDMFYESFNHELIHAYDYAKYGLTGGRSYRETKAYRWTDRFTMTSTMPGDIPVYKGTMDLFDIPNYLVPTKMPLIPIPPITLLQIY